MNHIFLDFRRFISFFHFYKTCSYTDVNINSYFISTSFNYKNKILILNSKLFSSLHTDTLLNQFIIYLNSRSHQYFIQYCICLKSLNKLFERRLTIFVQIYITLKGSEMIYQHNRIKEKSIN